MVARGVGVVGGVFDRTLKLLMLAVTAQNFYCVRYQETDTWYQC